LLGDLANLRDVYNSSLARYRQLHRLRSRTHPVADLTSSQDWLEAPFWLWTAADPRRKRMFARGKRDCVEITDRRNLRLCLPLRSGNLENAVTALETAAQGGLRIRPRALITTMFARVFLGDLFLHGIGGAKYDQLTDEIIRRYWQFEPPPYMTLSATLLLPVQRENVQPADVRRIDHLLRELQYHPEKHAPADTRAQELAEEKRRWLGPVAPELGPARHRATRRINAAFQPLVEPLRLKLLDEREQLAQRLRSAALLESREFAFCLFPESLCTNLLDILQKHS
jgi:hypothetical protein